MTTSAKPAAIHPFEKAGLGTAPFRCIGSHESKYQACPGAPVQPGSSCDYCGTGIMTVFVIKSADGRTFKVGCDCVAKTYRDCANTPAERDARRLQDQVNKLKTAAANARKDVRIDAARETLETFRSQLAAMWYEPPPAKFAKTMADQLDWMLGNGGRALKVRAAKMLADIVAEQGWA